MKNPLLAAAMLLLVSIWSAHAAPTDSASPAEQQIRAALTHWVEAANRGDYKAALSVWAPDLIGWAPDGSDDSYALEQKFAMQPMQPPKTTYALTINEVIVDGTLAVVRDTWTQTMHGGASGDKPETFRSFEVWRRQPDASWKIIRWIDGPLTKGGS
jgi:ketosteroid isomerase-like protein